MNKEIQVGDWSFEIVQIRARKTPKYGNPYTGICNITIVNGEPHIEGLLTTEPLTFNDVRSIHFLSYIRYLYFNVGRMAYLQANVLSAYVFLAPAIVAGVVTLGVMQQIIRAFGRVEGSMQYIFRSWPTIIELASVYKRLKEFESKINLSELMTEKD